MKSKLCFRLISVSGPQICQESPKFYRDLRWFSHGLHERRLVLQFTETREEETRNEITSSMDEGRDSTMAESMTRAVIITEALHYSRRMSCKWGLATSRFLDAKTGGNRADFVHFPKRGPLLLFMGCHVHITRWLRFAIKGLYYHLVASSVGKLVSITWGLQLRGPKSNGEALLLLRYLGFISRKIPN